MHFCTFSLANTLQIKLLLKQVQLNSSILKFFDMYCIYLVISQGFSPPKQPQKSASVILEGNILTAALAKTDQDICGYFGGRNLCLIVKLILW